MKFKSFEIQYILEKLQYTDELEDILINIKSPIASDILSSEFKEIDEFNVITKSDSDDMVLFDTKKTNNKVLWAVQKPSLGYYYQVPQKIQDKYINKVSNGITSRLAYPSYGAKGYIESEIDKNELWGSSKRIVVLQLVDQNKSEVPHKLLIEFEGLSRSNPISEPNQKLKIGRFARKILSSIEKKYTDKEIESFVNEFKSQFEIQKDAFRNFELVSGPEIKHWYSEKNYEIGHGPLQNSCMRYDVCQSFFKIYTENPDVCKLLILKDPKNPNLISARALVWEAYLNDDINKKITYMDRVYFTKDSQKMLFFKYAESKKWENEDNRDVLTVKIKNWDFSKYPYMDTFKYLIEGFNFKDKCATISSDGDEDSGYFLESTEGGNGRECETCGGTGTLECDDCGGSGEIYCDECSRGEVDCNECGGDGEIECEECGGDGEIDGSECSECKGDGRIKCGECKGDGVVDCSNCDGSGDVNCARCDGEGQYDCYDC